MNTRKTTDPPERSARAWSALYGPVYPRPTTYIPPRRTTAYSAEYDDLGAARRLRGREEEPTRE